MLIGMYGVFAVGKTTFLKENMDMLADAIIPERGLVVVLADLAEEYHYNTTMDEWVLVNDNQAWWKGKREEKLQHLSAMIRDRKTLYVVESARYFGGLQQEMLSIVHKVGGGLRFIVPYCSEPTARQFLMDRCAKRNKVFRADYWTEKRLRYECKDRYTNIMNNHYIPNGVECFSIEIDYQRTRWKEVLPVMMLWAGLLGKHWYNGNVMERSKSSLPAGVDISGYQDSVVDLLKVADPEIIKDAGTSTIKRRPV